MKKFLLPALFLLTFSCATDDQPAGKSDSDSIADAGVDTFSVKRSHPLTEAEKKENDASKKETDSVINEAQTIINQGNADPNVVVASTAVVTNPDVAPAFPGGEMAMENYIAKKKIYPLVAFQNEIKGTVIVRFVVEADGTIGGIRVVRGIGYGCDESAVELVRGMPKWTPGKKAGVNVRCAVDLPVAFGN